MRSSALIRHPLMQNHCHEPSCSHGSKDLDWISFVCTSFWTSSILVHVQYGAEFSCWPSSMWAGFDGLKHYRDLIENYKIFEILQASSWTSTSGEQIGSRYQLLPICTLVDCHPRAVPHSFETPPGRVAFNFCRSVQLELFLSGFYPRFLLVCLQFLWCYLVPDAFQLYILFLFWSRWLLNYWTIEQLCRGLLIRKEHQWSYFGKSHWLGLVENVLLVLVASSVYTKRYWDKLHFSFIYGHCWISFIGFVAVLAT